MLLDITNNFSCNVNIDPEIGSPPCVTYLMIDFDSLLSDKTFLKLANFELNVEDYVDALQGEVIIENTKEAFRFAEAPSLFFNTPVTLTFMYRTLCFDRSNICNISHTEPPFNTLGYHTLIGIGIIKGNKCGGSHLCKPPYTFIPRLLCWLLCKGTLPELQEFRQTSPLR